MRNIGYLILSIFLFVSCAKSKEMKTEMYKADAVMEELATESFENENRTKQKLQDYFDLLVLQQKNPEFKEDIKKQLQNITTANKTVLDTNTIQIQNLRMLGASQKISDTVTKMKIAFDIVTVNKIEKDTIITIIKTKKVTIDGRELVSSKIRFLNK